jgi:undecaprenyl-diphosphatase
MQTDSGVGTFDERLLFFVNRLAGHNHALDWIMVASAKYLPVIFALALVALWLSWRPENQRGAFLAGASALVALGIGQLVSIVFPRPRPYLSHQVTLLITNTPDSSFPSDHATLGFAVAVMIWIFNRTAGAALLLLALLLAFSRVFVGAHYPGDVIGGAILGSLTSWLLSVLSEKPPLKNGIDNLMALLSRWRLAARHA